MCNVIYCSKLQQFKLTLIWLGMKFGSKFIVDFVSGKSLYIVYISTPVLCPYSISRWLMEGHGGPIRLCWKNSKVLPVLPGFSLSVQLRPILPFIASFCPWSVSPLSSVPSLSLHPSLKGTLGKRSVLPLFYTSSLNLSPSHLVSPPFIPLSRPTRASLVVCLSSVEVSFLGELRWKDCFSCVYTKTVRSPFSQNDAGAVWFNRCPHGDGIAGVICLNLIYGFFSLVMH